MNRELSENSCDEAFPAFFKPKFLFLLVARVLTDIEQSPFTSVAAHLRDDASLPSKAVTRNR